MTIRATPVPHPWYLLRCRFQHLTTARRQQRSAERMARWMWRWAWLSHWRLTTWLHQRHAAGMPARLRWGIVERPRRHRWLHQGGSWRSLAWRMADRPVRWLRRGFQSNRWLQQRLASRLGKGSAERMARLMWQWASLARAKTTPASCLAVRMIALIGPAHSTHQALAFTLFFLPPRCPHHQYWPTFCICMLPSITTSLP